MNADPVKQAWQASVEIAGTPPLKEVRAGADKFYRAIRWRNLIEYAACAVVVVSFGAYAFTLPTLLQRFGSALVVLATFYTVWQLHRRGSAEAPEMAGTMPLYAFLRAQLVRQRDALKAIFWWYLLPFLPGMALLMAGSLDAPDTHPDGASWRDAVGLAVMAAIFIGVWWLNQLGARKLQKHIDEIDVLTGGNE
jgi:voltage-gated potassium channel Kch